MSSEAKDPNPHLPRRELFADVKRGRPVKGTEDATIAANRPWETEGVSRKTWYRRRKDAAKASLEKGD